MSAPERGPRKLGPKRERLRQLRKAREPWEYEVVANQIFTLSFQP